MKKDRIDYLNISDIHFGSNLNKTADIIAHLDAFFLEHDLILSKLDIFFILGDIFDRILNASSIDYLLITSWLTRLVHYCKKNNIKLRVLEGTPSHDGKQAKVLDNILTNLDVKIDYKYFEDVAIETMSDLGLTVLYIPDEVNHNSEDTLNEVKELMLSKRLTKVDIAMMHGAFKYQIPVVDLPSMHNEHEYLSLVREFISIGHIHKFSVFKRIIAQGSFDRMAHGEEEDKGLVLITLRKDCDSSFKFMPNKLATIFKSIKVTSEDIFEVIRDVGKVVADLRVNSHVRLIVRKDNPINKSMLEIYKKFPNYRFTNKTIDVEENISQSKLDSVLSKPLVDNLQITEDNIRSLLLDGVKKHESSEDTIRIAMEELELVLKK